VEGRVFVSIDLPSEGPQLVGTLWARVRKGRESGTFRYDESWLGRRSRFALEPALTLDAGEHHTAPGKALFGALGDSAPDRWGRLLMRRAERVAARGEGRAPRTLFEFDHLLGVTDVARQGALRFRLAEDPESPFVAVEKEGSTIPPLVELPALLAASDKVDGGDISAEQLRLLLAPGSSLGGARPKASVRDLDGHLAIAKFPHKSDDIDVVRWEGVALALAKRAGITVPEWRLETVDQRPVLIVRRFDRLEDQRVPFLSAMSMLGANDRETHSYLELVDVLRQHGARPTEDMHQLWRRIVYSVLISNTDDHLRNHGFLWAGESGWALSPAYDLNPVPVDIKPRILSTAIDLDSSEASFELALEVAEYFGLDAESAARIGREVAEAVVTWREVAGQCGLPREQIDRMESAFEHDDLQLALQQ
jgi:serine/threonine-protein kinase HipA